MRRTTSSVQVGGGTDEVHAHLVVAGEDRVILRYEDGEAERAGVLFRNSDLAIRTAALDGVGLCIIILISIEFIDLDIYTVFKKKL